MIRSLLYINIAIFIFLSVLHVYWAIGGRWGTKAVIPADSNGRPLFKPSGAGTVTVAIILFLFAVLDLAYIDTSLPVLKYLPQGILLVGILFLARAIGDFRYIGFSKRHKRGAFAKMDYIFYSPLCLFISASQLAAYAVE